MSSVEVVIPTFNRHDRLLETLASLERQTFRDFHVTVVDDCSSPPVAGRIPPRLMASLGVRILTTDGNGGPGGARNLGVAATTARYIAFIDDDVDADATWLANHLRAVESGTAVISFGPLMAPADWSPTPWNYWEAATLRREYVRMIAGRYEPTWRQFFTGNALVPRELLLRAGGFDPRFTRAEDIELGLRMHNAGARFAFTPGAIGWHYANRTLESWLRIPREYARFDVAITAMYPGIDWLATIDGERAARGRAVLLTRRMFRHETTWRAARRLAVASARLAFAAGRRAAAAKVLSLVYDIEYGLARARPRTVETAQPVTASEFAVTTRPPALHGDGRNS